MCFQVQVIYEGKNDRIKLLVLLCGDDEEDKDLISAAAAALAILTGLSKKCCAKVFNVSYTYS